MQKGIFGNSRGIACKYRILEIQKSHFRIGNIYWKLHRTEWSEIHTVFFYTAQKRWLTNHPTHTMKSRLECPIKKPSQAWSTNYMRKTHATTAYTSINPHRPETQFRNPRTRSPEPGSPCVALDHKSWADIPSESTLRRNDPRQSCDPPPFFSSSTSVSPRR